MKIYPSKHQILQVDAVNLNTDIPLGYIDTNSKEYSLTITSMLKSDGINPIVPYTIFDTYNMCFFKPMYSNNISNSSDFYKIDHQSIIQRVNEQQYQYIPLNSMIFEPETFNYEVIVKKNLKFEMTRTYNIKVNCIDALNTNFLSKELIKIFGDAPSRGISPSNIWINNKDLSINSLANNYYNKLDFIFIDSKDGKTYDRYDIDTDMYGSFMDINKEYLSNQTNVWMCVENFPIELTDNNISIQSPTLYNNIAINTKSFDNQRVTKTTFVVDDENSEEVIMHTLFKDKSCAIIKEYKNKGFVIYTPKNFFENLNQNVSLFYEILFYVYKNTYLKSDEINQWIADNIPDYIVTNNTLTTIDKFSTKKTLYELFNLPKGEVQFSKINIDKENIQMTGEFNSYLLFKKLYTGEFSKYADPIKTRDTMISIYTPQKRIIYFDEFIYTIQDNVLNKINYIRENNGYRIQLKDFKNSYYNININNEKINDIIIPLTVTKNYVTTPINNSNFYLCCKENLLNYCLTEDYTEDKGVIIAQINISKTNNETKVYDMRRRGGGLPIEEEDDYNLLDIGNIYGLAYRKAGTVVITLPTKLKVYDEIIKKLIKKHIVAEKLFVIIYEDKKDGEE